MDGPTGGRMRSSATRHPPLVCQRYRQPQKRPSPPPWGIRAASAPGGSPGIGIRKMTLPNEWPGIRFLRSVGENRMTGGFPSASTSCWKDHSCRLNRRFVFRSSADKGGAPLTPFYTKSNLRWQLPVAAKLPGDFAANHGSQLVARPNAAAPPPVDLGSLSHRGRWQSATSHP